MNNRKNIMMLVMSTIILATIMLIGLTYAYYKVRMVENSKDKSISVTSKKLEITYADGNGAIEGTAIKPGYTITKTFSVENTGDAAVTYSVMFEEITNTFIRTEDWTYVLKKGDTKISSGTIVNGNYQVVIPSISIDAKATDSYTLTLTYAKLALIDQSVDMGATLSLKVNIDSDKITWNSAKEGTLLYAIKNNNTVTEPLTKPGAEASSETEAVLSSTEDDYGTSYYFRGNVKNNYVNFAKMCWRIVRVEGNGNIKVILEAGSGECNSSSYSAGSSVISTPYRYTLEKNTNDFKYGTSALKQWLEGATLLDGGRFSQNMDDTKLAETEWCNDMSIANKQELDYRFGAYDRLVTGKNPTLKCNMVGLNGTKTLKVKSKVGAITADEVVFAGGVYVPTGEDDNYSFSHYLKEQGTSWTMSPLGYTIIYDNVISFADVWYMDSNGELKYSYDMDYSAPARPLVAFLSDVEITEGAGTKDNPYVIK